MMREVILSEDSKRPITLSEVDTNKFYGVVEPSGRKGVVIFLGTSQVYRAFIASDINTGNCWSGADGATLRGTLSVLLKFSKVYEFSTPKELYAWLAE
jgi:hypothetical protein